MDEQKRFMALFVLPSMYTMASYMRPLTAEQRRCIDSLNMSTAFALESEYGIDIDDTITIAMALQLGYVPAGEDHTSQENFWRAYLMYIHNLVSQQKDWRTEPQFADYLVKASGYLETFRKTIKVTRSSEGGESKCKVESFTSAGAGPRLGSWNFTPGDETVTGSREFYDQFLRNAKDTFQNAEWYEEYDMDVKEYTLTEGDKRE